MPKVPKIRSLLIFKISLEKRGNKVEFLFIDTSFLQVDSTQNNKFAISSQYLKENVRDEVDFLPADKRQRFLPIDTIILDVCGQTCPNYPK